MILFFNAIVGGMSLIITLLQFNVNDTFAFCILCKENWLYCIQKRSPGNGYIYIPENISLHYGQ